MVAEVTMICVDNSSFFHKYSSMCMRHQADAFEVYCRVKIQYNPENTVGVFTLCEKKHRMLLLLPTNDLAKIRTFKRRIEGLKPGGLMKFQDGLDMATMGFMCGDNEKMKKRFVVFAGGDLSYSRSILQKLRNSLKMKNIALDFVMVGSRINATMVKAFVAAVNNNDNSHILYVASAPSIRQAILSPRLFPQFEDRRRLVSCGGILMEMESAAQKKEIATYCDENGEPHEMNKKDNQSTKLEKSVSQIVALLLKSISCLISVVLSPWLLCVVYIFMLLKS